MTSLRRAAVALASAVTLTSLALLAPATSASAAPVAPGISSSQCPLQPTLVTLADKPENVKFDVKSAYPYWSMRFTTDDLGVQGPYLLPDKSDLTFKLSPAKLYNSTAGLVPVKLDLYEEDLDLVGTCNTSFRLLRASKTTVAVKKVKNGRQISGTVRRVSFGQPADRTWIKVKGQGVSIEVKKKGQWVSVDWVKTAADGTFSSKVKASKKKSQWRAVFGGMGSTTTSTSKTVTK
ncbi:hypothetical protein LWF15_01705 [Kineosporia rhizophila]|uniref:hypothetical protein n=1 Tax=Kineosporia TaxID=49184 RepID=UPI001E3AF6D1|nr:MULTISPECIES: hypothetical protein [Kineosporia]MCE0534214.1 hypothetical protein [Kineosporia rhizophila]GLY13761.1 hypothetical protein Kisp01_07770 [Kineosporia sp. NBRC 101677]